MSSQAEIYKQIFRFTLQGNLLTDENRKIIRKLVDFIRDAGVKQHQLRMLQEKLGEHQDMETWREDFKELAERKKAGGAWNHKCELDDDFKNLLRTEDDKQALNHLLPDAIKNMARQRIDEITNEMNARRIYSRALGDEEREKLINRYCQAAQLDFYFALIKQFVIDEMKP